MKEWIGETGQTPFRSGGVTEDGPGFWVLYNAGGFSECNPVRLFQTLTDSVATSSRQSSQL